MQVRGAVVITVLASLLAAAQATAQQDARPPAPSPATSAPVSQARPQITAAPAFAGTDSYQGWIVQDIHVEGARHGVEDRVLGMVVQPVNAPINREAIRQSVRVLYGTGRYADVAVQVDALSDRRLSLTFVVVPNYFVGAVTVEGAPDHPTEGQIINASKLELGQRLTVENVARALERVRLLMQDNGFYQAKVAYSEKPDPETQQIGIHFEVVPRAAARVGEIKINSDAGLSLEEAEEAAHLHPGDRVTSERISGALERLRKHFRKRSRLTAQVSITERKYLADKNTVGYTFHIDPGPIVDIAVEGFRIPKSEVKQRVPVYEENAADEDLLNEGKLNLRDYMQSRGFFDAQVRVTRKQDLDGRRLHVVFDIDRGERHKLLKVEVKGNQYFLTEDLISRMQVQPAGKLFSHGRFSQTLLNSDMRGLQDLYHASGFAKVLIQPRVVDDFEGNQNVVAIFLKVEEGPQTLVGALHFEGSRSMNEDALRSKITYLEDQPYSDYNLAGDRDSLLAAYLDQGFPDARIETSSKLIPGQTNRMDVTYTFREGEKVVIDQILISGLDHTQQKIVEREIRVQGGDPLSQQRMLDTQRNLYDLGIFSQVDVALQDPDGHEQDKNLLVAVREAKRYTFNYGIGFEAQTGQPNSSSPTPQGRTGVSPRVSFDVTRLNFRGLNHTIVFKSNLGALQQRALLRYEAPRLFDNEKWRLSLTTFYDNTLSVTTFTLQRLEGAIQAEQTLSDRPNFHSTLQYRYAYRRVKATIASNFNPDLVPLLSRPSRVGGPGISYLRDKRNSVTDTQKGNYTTFDLNWASRYFGSEADFTRLIVQNSTYHLFGKKKKFVLARSTRIGAENTFHNTLLPLANAAIPDGFTTIPLPERLFAGGGSSLRGFAINQAGPRDLQSGQPLGGAGLFLNNIELRLPPVKWPYVKDNLGFVIFNDLGNVFDTPRHILTGLSSLHQKNLTDCKSLTPSPDGKVCDFNYLVAAIGAGIHYKTPIGPVRLDFGYNLNPPVFPVRVTTDVTHPAHIETSRRFNIFFSIGQTF